MNWWYLAKALYKAVPELRKCWCHWKRQYFHPKAAESSLEQVQSETERRIKEKKHLL